jgi:hypothetical protein
LYSGEPGNVILKHAWIISSGLPSVFFSDVVTDVSDVAKYFTMDISRTSQT